MGFYDCRCMVTGLTLEGDATLVVLRQAGDAYQPITLGIAGSYDRYGSIDGVEEDVNTGLVFSYFLDRRRDGRFFTTSKCSTSKMLRPPTSSTCCGTFDLRALVPHSGHRRACSSAVTRCTTGPSGPSSTPVTARPGRPSSRVVSLTIPVALLL
jgi:hypothetical protein